MSRRRFNFASLRQLLAELGFQEVPVREPFIGFQHQDPETVIILAQYRNNAAVAAHHLVQVRIALDAKGFMGADEFYRIVANGPIRHSASS